MNAARSNPLSRRVCTQFFTWNVRGVYEQQGCCTRGIVTRGLLSARSAPVNAADVLGMPCTVSVLEAAAVSPADVNDSVALLITTFGCNSAGGNTKLKAERVSRSE